MQTGLWTLNEIPTGTDCYHYELNGTFVGMAVYKLSEDGKNINIIQFGIYPEYRREGIGTIIVNYITKNQTLLAHGEVLAPHSARFWGTFDSSIPTDLDDEGLEDWCDKYGMFEFGVKEEPQQVKVIGSGTESRITMTHLLIDSTTNTIGVASDGGRGIIESKLLEEASKQCEVLDYKKQKEIKKNQAERNEKWFRRKLR